MEKFRVVTDNKTVSPGQSAILDELKLYRFVVREIALVLIHVLRCIRGLPPKTTGAAAVVSLAALFTISTSALAVRIIQAQPKSPSQSTGSDKSSGTSKSSRSGANRRAAKCVNATNLTQHRQLRSIELKYGDLGKILYCGFDSKGQIRCRERPCASP